MAIGSLDPYEARLRYQTLRHVLKSLEKLTGLEEEAIDDEQIKKEADLFKRRDTMPGAM